MQQVFLLVNRLLRKEPATCKRRLSIRTYKVRLSVCLSVCPSHVIPLFGCLLFWSLSPFHNPPTPSPTLHILSTHFTYTPLTSSPFTHTLVCTLNLTTSHSSPIHTHSPTHSLTHSHLHTLTGDSTFATLRDSGLL